MSVCPGPWSYKGELRCGLGGLVDDHTEARMDTHKRSGLCVVRENETESLRGAAASATIGTAFIQIERRCVSMSMCCVYLCAHLVMPWGHVCVMTGPMCVVWRTAQRRCRVRTGARRRRAFVCVWLRAVVSLYKYCFCISPCSAVTPDFLPKDLPQQLGPSLLIVLSMALLSLLGSRGRPYGQ